MPTPADDPQADGAAAGSAQADHMLRAMRAVLARHHPGSAAEALQVLRRGYPDSPLSMRIAALCAAGK